MTMSRTKDIPDYHDRNKDLSSKTRDEVLHRAEIDFEKFKKTHTFKFPTWLYGSPKGKLFKLRSGKIVLASE